jgi:hypothetical protein
VIELSQALPHGGLAQGLLTLVTPRAQIETLAAAQFSHPPGTVKILVIPSGNYHKIDGRYATETVEMANLVLEVLHELPLAIVAFEICRRETRQKQPRFPEALKDALPPILHPTDFIHVEEGNKFAPGKRSEVLLDALNQLGDATLLVVAARIADENVVGHGLIHLAGFQADRVKASTPGFRRSVGRAGCRLCFLGDAARVIY